MDSTDKLSSAQYLKIQLQEIMILLEKQQLEKSLLERTPGAHHDLLETVLRKQQETRLEEKLSALHPADIAYILESLPLDERKLVWAALTANMHGQVLVEVSDAVRQTLISGMEVEDMASFAENLDADEIADLADDLPRNAMLKILRFLNSEERQHVNAVLAYEDDQVGAFMDFGMIAIRADLTLRAISDYIRKLGKLPSQTDKLFVVDQNGVVKGVLPLQRLLTHAPQALVESVMVTEFVEFRVDQSVSEASRAFERYDLISAPVVDADGKLQGRLCINDMLDYIREESDEDMLIQAGVAEEEDLFSSVWKSAKNRWGWLMLNIATAFISTRIIGVFEDTILRLVALASLMPIIAATGGNSGNQTSILIIRSLALGQITELNIRRVIRKELSLGLLNGLFIGVIVGSVAFALYRDVQLAGVMGLAMFLNLLVAVVAGLAIPLLRHKWGKDPAAGASVMLTSITDAMGFFIFLGLASWVLH